MQPNKYAEVFYKEYCDVLTKNFRSYLEQELYIDVIFLCKFNKKVPAHQIVLGSFSSLLYELFKDHQQYFKGHIAYICLPDIKASSLQNILQFIYYGKVALKNKKDLSYLFEDLALLDLPSNAVTSETEPFCTYITGVKNSNVMVQPVSVNESNSNSNKTNHDLTPKLKVTTDCKANFKSNDTEAATCNTGVVSPPAPSSLPVISNVITLVRNHVTSVSNANHQETIPNESKKKKDVHSEQQMLVSSSEESSREKQPTPQSSSPELDQISGKCIPPQDNHPTLPSCNEDESNKKKNDLLAVLKKVMIACHNLESVGVTEDESIRTNLQSCIRFLKQGIADIRELLSSEVTISSQENYKFIDVEKDWELKVMLNNCLETLPRLEKAIENSHHKGRRHRRKERRESVDRLEHQQQKTPISNENSSAGK